MTYGTAIGPDGRHLTKEERASVILDGKPPTADQRRAELQEREADYIPTPEEIAAACAELRAEQLAAIRRGDAENQPTHRRDGRRKRLKSYGQSLGGIKTCRVHRGSR